MKASIGHFGINLSSLANLKLWKDLCTFLDFEITDDGEHFDASDGTSYLCVSLTEKAHAEPSFHRKRTGLNHIALRVSSKELVDEFVEEFLTPRKIEPLYKGAKSYPQYTDGYYAVFFEDHDRIKIEIVFE